MVIIEDIAIVHDIGIEINEQNIVICMMISDNKINFFNKVFIKIK